MKFNSLLKLSFALIVFCQFSCMTFEPVKLVRIENFNSTLKDKDPQVTLDLVIENPNKFGLTLTQLNTDIALSKKQISTVSLASKKRIIPKGNTPVPLHITIDSEKLKSVLPSALMAYLTGSLDVQLKGSVKVKKFIFGKRIPFTIDQKVSL